MLLQFAFFFFFSLVFQLVAGKVGKELKVVMVVVKVEVMVVVKVVRVGVWVVLVVGERDQETTKIQIQITRKFCLPSLCDVSELLNEFQSIIQMMQRCEFQLLVVTVQI